MNRDLCDETFPSSLLIAFDDLSDEIPVSPEPVVLRRHQQPLSKQKEQGIISTTSVATTTTSSTITTTTVAAAVTTVGNLSDEGTGNRTGSRTIVSGSSNTSSGHSSLSTEGDNRSASSERDTSREHEKRLSMPSSFVRTSERPNQLKTDSKSKLRQPRSLQLSAKSANQDQKQLSKDTGSLKTAGSSVNSSGSSNGTDRYHRYRNSKYAHVPSKVKQQIDQLKSTPSQGMPTSGDRKTLVRHKSMPETVSGELLRLDEDEALEQEDSLAVLRTMVRELRLQLANQQQLHEFYQAKQFTEIDALKFKNDFLRMENDRLMELERCREQQRQLARSQQHQSQAGGSCYGSHSSLHKMHATSTVACQTSPTVSFEVDHFSDQAQQGTTRVRATSSPATSGTTRLRRSTHVQRRHHRQASSSAEEPDSPVLGEFSPDYEQLIPVLGGGVRRDGNAPSLSFGTVYLPDDTDGVPGLEEHFDQDFADPSGRPLDRTASSVSGCRDCRRKKQKKRKTRRQKLASLFCLRRHDESI